MMWVCRRRLRVPRRRRGRRWRVLIGKRHVRRLLLGIVGEGRLKRSIEEGGWWLLLQAMMRCKLLAAAEDVLSLEAPLLDGVEQGGGRVAVTVVD